MLASSMMLVACGSGDSAEEDTSTEEGTEQVEEGKESVGDVIEAEGGTREVISVANGINETIENGDFSITLREAQLSEFDPKGEMEEVFGKDPVGMVTANFEVKYKGEDTGTIYPDQSTLVTNTGHQVEAELFLSDSVGGEFYGEVTKEGEVFYIFDSKEDVKEIDNVRIIVGSGQNEDWESFGEDLEFSIDFKTK